MSRPFIALSALVLSLAAGAAWAQTYPNKPITYIHPFIAGGSDAVLRSIFDRFRERTGQPILIEYRPGANTVVAQQATLRAPADGYTFTYVTVSSLPGNLATFVLPFGVDDFSFITQVSAFDQALVVGPSVPATVKTFPEFVTWAKSRGGKQVNLANNSAVAKLMMMIMGEKTGLPWVEIPFKGGSDSLLSIMSGQSDFHFVTITTIGGQLKEGKLRVLAIASEKRAKDFPDVPTLNESVPGFAFDAWVGLAARAGTPRQNIDLLFREFTTAMKSPDVAKKMTDAGNPPAPSNSPEEFAQKVRRETELYVRTAKAAGIVPQPLQ